MFRDRSEHVVILWPLLSGVLTLQNRRLTSSKPNSDRPSDKGTPERINCSNSDCPRQLCNPLEIRNSSQYDGSRNSTYRDQTDFSASSLAAHCGSPAALSFSTEEFPSLSDSSTPIKGECLLI